MPTVDGKEIGLQLRLPEGRVRVPICPHLDQVSALSMKVASFCGFEPHFGGGAFCSRPVPALAGLVPIYAA